MDKVTYLIGAGASAQAIPVINTFNQGLRKFEKALRTTDVSRSGDFLNHKNSLAQEIQALHHVLGVQEDGDDGKKRERLLHSSIDTYAKKLFILEQDNPPTHLEHSRFERLKILMSLYLTFEQLQYIDVRYESFFATILKDTSNVLPSNVRIVSWNYDSQVELAYHSFRQNESLEASSEMLNVISKFTLVNSSDHTHFALLKINGTANFKHGNESQIVVKPRGAVNAVEHVVDLYAQYIKDPHIIRSGVSFAWEDDAKVGNTTDKPILKSVKQEIADTKVLVVIGYSFPLFNRQVDKAIFQELNGSLIKIYIQDKEPDKIRERILSFADEEGTPMELIKDVDQFVFPLELDI